MGNERVSRRQFLAGVSLGMAGIAGCNTIITDPIESEDRTTPVKATPANEPVTPAKETQRATERPSRRGGHTWAMYGFDSTNSGYSPDAVPPSDVSKSWSFKTVGSASPPAIVDELVFVSAGSTYALGSDGEIQWKRPDVNAQTGSFPAVADGKVLFCSESGFGDEDPPPYLYALDAETGQTEWRTEFAEDFSVSPTIVDRTVYVGGYDQQLSALDLDDGSLQWTVEFEKLARGTPAADEDVVVSGSESVYVLDADSGKKHWSKPITISGSPTLTDDTVYVGSNDAIYYALDRETGETRWKYDMDELTFGSTAVVGDTVYVTCGTAAYAFDRHSGEQQWQYRADGEASSPAVAGSTLFVGTAGKQLHAIDIDSGIRDFVVSLGSSAGHPVVTDGTVYVSTHDGLFVYTE